MFASLFLNAFWRSDAFVWNASDAFFLNLFLNLLFSSVGQRQTFSQPAQTASEGQGISAYSNRGVRRFPNVTWLGFKNSPTVGKTMEPLLALHFNPLVEVFPGFSVNFRTSNPPPPPKKKRYPTSILWFVFFWPLGSHEFRSRYIRYIFHDINFLPNSEQIFRKIFQGFLLPSICPLRLFFLPLVGEREVFRLILCTNFWLNGTGQLCKGCFQGGKQTWKISHDGCLGLKSLESTCAKSYEASSLKWRLTS